MTRNARTEAVEAQMRVKERIRSKTLVAQGFMFCLSCQKISEDIGEERRECCFCGSPRLKWNPGIGRLEETENTNQTQNENTADTSERIVQTC